MKLYMLERYANHFLGVYSSIDLVKQTVESLKENVYATYIVTEIELDTLNNPNWPAWITRGEHPLEWKRM